MSVPFLDFKGKFRLYRLITFFNLISCLMIFPSCNFTLSSKALVFVCFFLNINTLIACNSLNSNSKHIPHFYGAKQSLLCPSVLPSGQDDDDVDTAKMERMLNNVIQGFKEARQHVLNPANDTTVILTVTGAVLSTGNRQGIGSETTGIVEGGGEEYASMLLSNHFFFFY